MPSEQRLSFHCVSDGAERGADIVFVHGLTGSAEKTWGSAQGTTGYWPPWLSSYGNIWLLDYPADLFWWSASGAQMALPERAKSVIDFLVNHRIGNVVFVTHSLGGLLVKPYQGQRTTGITPPGNAC